VRLEGSTCVVVSPRVAGRGVDEQLTVAEYGATFHDTGHVLGFGRGVIGAYPIGRVGRGFKALRDDLRGGDGADCQR